MWAKRWAEQSWIKDHEEEQAARLKKYARLKDLDLVVMDNIVRESTVGQLRGHTAEDHLKIYEEAKKCGFKVGEVRLEEAGKSVLIVPAYKNRC